jgi:hypothetical protein
MECHKGAASCYVWSQEAHEGVLCQDLNALQGTLQGYAYHEDVEGKLGG